MVGTVEQETCAAGNGAKFANNQPIMVNGIMVKNIIPLEINRNEKLYKNALTILAIISKKGGGITPLYEKKWKAFYIRDIFVIRSGKRLTKAICNWETNPL